MNIDELSYLSPEDYFRDYKDNNLTAVLSSVAAVHGREILLNEDLLKQELQKAGINTMDIYKLLLISKCHGFNKLIMEENINSYVELERLTNNIFNQTLLNRADIMKIIGSVVLALGIVSEVDTKKAIEKVLENIESGGYSYDELKSTAFALPSSEYQNRTLSYFENIIDKGQAGIDSITDEDFRSLEALLINGIPKAKYYAAYYMLHSSKPGFSSEKAISLLKEASDSGDAQAAAKLADYYYSWHNYDRAYQLYTGVGALALTEKRRDNILSLFNQKLYYKNLLKFSAVLYIILSLSMIVPLGFGIYSNFTIAGILFSMLALGVLALGFVVNRLKPYFNIQFIPAALFIVWFFDMLIRLIN